MSLEKAEEYLKNKGMLDHVIRLEDSTGPLWRRPRLWAWNRG